ncbi:rhsE element core protein RshE [Escherichia coli]|nr:rhsE element core protein RshE [Escherichia coli]
MLYTEGEGGLKRVVKKEHADGSITRSEYDEAGRLKAQTDAAGRRTEYRLHMASGKLTSVILPDGRTVRYGYNSQLQLTSVTYPDGLRSSRKYDRQGRLAEEISRNGNITRWFYDSSRSGLPCAVEDGTGVRRRITRNRYGQLQAFTDCSGYATRYEYDRYGQQIAIHREEGISTYSSYNPRGQLVSQKDAQGRETRYEYSAAGDLTATISPDGKRSTIEYDKRGRPVSVTEGGLTRSMGYDAAGRITTLTNENGSQSTFLYDPVDRLTEQRGFDGRTQRYQYDLTGKLTQSEDEGLITLWHYDASDRITHRTVNGDPAEQWQYDEHGWLTTISHTSEGHRVAVHYGYDDKGRLTGERQTVENPETGEILWEHETGHAYSEQGLATRQEPDGLPPVEWLTYGSGYLAGMKLGGTPLVEYTRDRLHRETVRSFGGEACELATAWNTSGQLQSRHLNLPQLDCDYTWNDNGQLIRISGPQESREYRYSDTGRLTGVHTTAANLDIDIPYATDPAGNRLPDPELHPDSTLTAWPDNRIAEDAHYVYRHDEYGRLAEKTDRIPEGVIRMHDERTHHYHYDSQHRLVFYTRIQHGEPQVESRYLYDPLGRRTGKRVWRRERDLTGWMSLSRKPEETWYGWDGDRLTTVQTQQTRIQTVYQPGSFTPLLRIETENGEQAKARHRDVIRYAYDNPHSELPATTTDATGSTRQMTWSRYGQLLAFTDCSGYQTRYEYDRFGQMTAVHREEGISLYRRYDNRGRLTSVKDAQGRETRYEYNAAGDLTAVITPDGNRSETQYDAWGKAVSTTQGGLTRSMEYDAAGRVISLTNENGSHSVFSYDALDRLVQQGGFDGRTQRYHYDLTGKLTQSEDEGLVILWYYDESDRITHRTVNGEPAEQWQYDGHGWLTDISHLSEGHRVAVHYGYDDKGRLTGECQTVENPETGELLWQHETKHAYNEQGLANRVTPDSLPPVEWLTYGSGYLAGMKLGGTPLVEYTRDRLHRETVRSFGSMAGSNAAYELTSTYTPAGQLQSQHLNSLVYDRDYGWSDNGDLVRISGPRQTREYGYSATGRLESVRTLAPDLDIRIPYATDPAGNRLPDPELHPDSTLTVWPDNRIAEDAHYVYRHDEYGRLTEKTDRIPAGVIRTDDERTHHYHYDSQHRLVFYTRIQHGEPLVESRYLYDPLGRRMAKRVWRRERDLTGWMSLSRKPEETWYGWDGDRLTTVQTDTTRIQTVYQPGSFAPLIRIETDNGEREKAQCRSLAEKIQQEGSEDGHGVVFPAELVGLLDRLEGEIRANCVSSESRQWLAQCGLTVERLAAQIEPVYLPERKIHLYHCDHRGLPLALISEDGNTAWSAEYDEWGNQLNEENPHHLHQPYRLPGQQYDKESGLYYNRHRYYDPLQGRYITPDPIGLRGGWNMYQYPLNPIQVIDPMGLDAIENMTSGGLIYAVSGVPGLIAANSITNSAYQFGYDMDAIVGGAHNGAADAMRHCYLMCRMTKTFGSTIADVIGKNHEAAGDRQGQPAKERIMDLKNNTVGIACGDFSAKCSDACIEKYNTGQLFGLDGIKADNPIKAKQGSSDASNY